MVRFRKISESSSESREIKGNLTSDWLYCSNSPGFWVALRLHYIFSVNVYTCVCVWIVVCLYVYLSLQLRVLLCVFLFAHASQWLRMRERFVVSFLKNISLQSFQVTDFFLWNTRRQPSLEFWYERNNTKISVPLIRLWLKG